MIHVVLYLLLCIFSPSLEGFSTLQDAQNYAQNTIEYPPIENENVLNPSFKHFHKRGLPSLITRFLEKAYLMKPTWSAYQLEQQISFLIEKSTQDPISNTITIKPPKGTEIVTIGPLFGAFHSLVRILSHFKEQGIISEELTIIKPNYYIVFNGNVIDGSPYILETLTLVTLLMEKNPDKVIYIQGQHENKQYWLNQGLNREIRARARFIPQLEQQLTQFFDSLPTAFDIIGNSAKEGVIRIVNLNEIIMNSRAEQLKAIIKAEDRLIDYAVHPGLLLLELKHGVTVWSVFSAPTTLYQDYFSFYNDAYTKITVGKPLIDTTISLYNRDVRTADGFKRIMVNNIITGQSILDKTIPLIHPTPENTITFGATMDLTRAHRYIGLDIKAGLSAAENSINQHGGMQGKFLKIIITDDQYNPVKSRANIEHFMKTISPIIICPVGSHTLAASLDLIREKKIYVLFTNSGSTKFRNPELKNIINFRASYAVEGKALTLHAHKKLLAKNFAFFCQDSGQGYSALSGAVEVLKKFGIKNWTETWYQPDTLNVAAAVESIKKANPDVIALFSVTTATREFIKQLGTEFLANKQLLANSPLGDKAFKQFLKEHGLRVTFAQAVPNPLASDLEIVKEYRTNLAALGLLPDTYSLEGYIYGQLTADLIGKIKGPITMDSLAQVIESIKNYHFKGLLLNYDPDNRQLANNIWLETPSGEWIKQDIQDLG